jgi:hypothetical protein
MNDGRMVHARNARRRRWTGHRAGAGLGGGSNRAEDCGAGHKPEYFHDRLKPLCKANRNSPRHDHSATPSWRNEEALPAELRPQRGKRERRKAKKSKSFVHGRVAVKSADLSL